MTGPDPAAPRPAHAGTGFDPLTAPAAALGLPARPGAAPPATAAQRPPATAGWPCSACGEDNPLAADVCGGCGAGFLSAVREAEGPLLELPVVGDLARLQRGQRLGLAFAVMIVVVGLATLLMLLTG